MVVQLTRQTNADLAEADETAWLEQTAELLRAGRFDQLDPDTLAEYLTDMAKRERREVYSRLVVLLAHLLKWDHQPTHRGGSWRVTLREQRRQLRMLLESGTLRRYAAEVWADAYADARLDAADETELPVETFPGTCPWELDAALADEAG